LTSQTANACCAVAAPNCSGVAATRSRIVGSRANATRKTDARYRVISSGEIVPSPSKSKSEKAHRTRASASPPQTTDMPAHSSARSTAPSESTSNASKSSPTAAPVPSNASPKTALMAMAKRSFDRRPDASAYAATALTAFSTSTPAKASVANADAVQAGVVAS